MFDLMVGKSFQEFDSVLNKNCFSSIVINFFLLFYLQIDTQKLPIQLHFFLCFDSNKVNFVTLNRLNEKWNKLKKRYRQIINKNQLHYPSDSLKIVAVGTFVNVHDAFPKIFNCLDKKNAIQEFCTQLFCSILHYV